MKILLTTIAAVVLVGCGEAQSPEPPKAKAPNISIHDAATDGNIEAVKQHLAAGVDVNVKDDVELTPLHWAALGGHKGIAELLLAKGADVNAKNNDGVTPLNWALGETADLIRKHGGKSGTEDSIHLAALKGNIEAVKQHLAAGADVNAKGRNGWTPLNIAAQEGYKEIAELLIAEGADVNAKDENGWTPLLVAAYWGGKEIAELLIAKGASVNAKGGIGGGTPLHRAAQEGYMEIVELLIAKGADVNATDMYRRTPLDMVIGLRRTATIDLLRKHGGKTRRELKAEGK